MSRLIDQTEWRGPYAFRSSSHGAAEPPHCSCSAPRSCPIHRLLWALCGRFHVPSHHRPSVERTEGPFKCRKAHKSRDWAALGGAGAGEDRGTSVRRRHKENTIWLRMIVSVISAVSPLRPNPPTLSTRSQRGRFSGDTGAAFIEWATMSEWSLHFAVPNVTLLLLRPPPK